MNRGDCLLSKRITIVDIARECGIAPSTVSNALADKDIVKPETKQKIKEIADRLGYRASITARALRTNKTNSIGFLASDIANSFYSEILKEVEIIASQNDFSLFLGSTEFNDNKQTKYIKSLIDKQIDGIILTSHRLQAIDRKMLDDAKIPIVCLNRQDNKMKADFVGVDNDLGISLAVNFLIKSNHKQIAYIGGPSVSSASKERLTAFRNTITKNNIELNEEFIVPGDYTEISGRTAAYQLLSNKRRPTAICCANDQMALGVLAVAKEMNLRVPENLSVVGFDDVDISSHPLIDLTTISTPRAELGRIAATMLIERLKNSDQENKAKEWKIIRLPPKLISRGTVLPPS